MLDKIFACHFFSDIKYVNVAISLSCCRVDFEGCLRGPWVGKYGVRLMETPRVTRATAIENANGRVCSVCVLLLMGKVLMLVLRDVEEEDHLEVLEKAVRANMEAIWRDVDKPRR